MQPRNLCSENTPPEDWVDVEVKKFEENYNTNLLIPKNDKGLSYSVDCLFDDQEQIVALVLDKVKEWLECDDPSAFEPMRLTINGPGGSGKSVIINTIVATMREMFGSNDVVRVIAPTGTAAFNVNGETFYRLMRNTVSKFQYKPNSMDPKKRKALVAKFQTLLALIIDERSLATSKDLGTVECQIAETIFGGGPLSGEMFGGLPIVILVGDDYQLPGASEGAFQARSPSKIGTKMVQRGRAVFKACAEQVVELTTSKRVQEDKIKDKELMDRLRMGVDIKDDDIKKLLSLHLDAINEKHGAAVVQDIEDRAIHLFFTNEKRIRRNLEQICKKATPDNPAARVTPTCTGPVGGKPVQWHFDEAFPPTSFLCLGARVAIEGRNFCPQWGLHNGACGIVEEIVYEKGHSPNLGNLPKYVVVHFPLYCGPPWDLDRPQVRFAIMFATALVHDQCFITHPMSYSQFQSQHSTRDATRVGVVAESIRL